MKEFNCNEVYIKREDRILTHPIEPTQNDHECVSMVASLCVDYGFKQILSHASIVGLQDDYRLRDSVCFYPTYMFYVENPKQTLIIREELPAYDVFYDKRRLFPVPEEEKDNFINIYGQDTRPPIFNEPPKEKFLGSYDKKCNTLYLCDMTHEYECIPEALLILEKIMTALGLKKAKKKKRYNPVKVYLTLGCDPEFMLYNSSGVVIPHTIGYGSTSSSAKIGADGAGNQLELRPSPSSMPKKIVKELKMLLKEVAQKQVYISTRGDDYPLGGHIHVGGAKPTKATINLLDYFLGNPTIDLSGTARSGYKYLGAYEPKDWGFEYRTPPAAIFENPEITKICLKIVKNSIKTLYRKGVLKLPDTPTAEEYRKICKLSYKEIEEFFHFIKTYKEEVNKTSLFAAWKLPLPKYKPELYKINYRDDWNETIKIKVTKQLLRGYTLIQEISIFGLRADRGFCTTLEDTDLNKLIRKETGFTHDLTYFGLAYEFRCAPNYTMQHKVIMDKIKKLLIANGILVKRGHHG